VAQQIEYGPFGEVLADSSPGFQPFGYAGGLYDHETGLVRFGARDYDPVVGRWLARDPIGFGGYQNNLYGYTDQDPINYIDPNGLQSILCYMPPDGNIDSATVEVKNYKSLKSVNWLSISDRERDRLTNPLWNTVDYTTTELQILRNNPTERIAETLRRKAAIDAAIMRAISRLLDAPDDRTEEEDYSLDSNAGP